MTLYEMTNAAKVLYELLESEEIDEQTVADNLEAIGTAEKMEAYAKIIKQLEADALAIKTEKMLLAEKQSRCEKAVERMKQAVIEFMKAANKTEDKAGVFKFNIRHNATCVVDNVEKIPSAYLTYAEPKVDKTAIKTAINSGEVIEGAHIEYNDTVNIK